MGQPTYLEKKTEVINTFKTNLANQIAKFHTHRNSSPTNKDELAGNALGALTKSSGIPTFTPAVSHIFTLMPAQALVLTQALASAQTPTLIPGLLGIYTDVKLAKITRLALELFIKS